MTTNNDAFAEALAEIEEGRLDKGAWARAYSESGGDESKAKALYIKARAKSITAAQAWPNTQPPVEDAPKLHAKPASEPTIPPDDRAKFYEAAIGQKNLDYYLNKFHIFDEKGLGLHASWNWAAFFGGGFWALYRKMYVWFFAWWALGTVVTFFAKIQNEQILVFLRIVLVVTWVGFTIFANSLYHCKVKARVGAAQRSNFDASQVRTRLNAGNGVHTWVAYIFGAIPVLGLVLAVALPAYQDYSKRLAMAAVPAQAPARPETSGKYGENDTLVSPAPESATTAPAERTQINDFLDGKPNTGQSERGPWEQWSTKTPPVPSAQGTATNPGVQYSPTPVSKAATTVAKNPLPQEQAKSATESADLNEAAQRAVRDFPYLDTPEGAKVLEKIVARRNELIQEGTYPALALTRAVNQYAAANAPQASAKGGTDS